MRISDWSSDVCSSDLMEDGLTALNAVKELMADLGRPRDNLSEVALWEDLVTVRGDEVFYAYLVDNQAIVIPETIDAIRALTDRDRDPGASMTKTNTALGIRRSETRRARKECYRTGRFRW